MLRQQKPRAFTGVPPHPLFSRVCFRLFATRANRAGLGAYGAMCHACPLARVEPVSIPRYPAYSLASQIRVRLTIHPSGVYLPPLYHVPQQRQMHRMLSDPDRTRLVSSKTDGCGAFCRFSEGRPRLLSAPCIQEAHGTRQGACRSACTLIWIVVACHMAGRVTIMIHICAGHTFTTACDLIHELG